MKFEEIISKILLEEELTIGLTKTYMYKVLKGLDNYIKEDYKGSKNMAKNLQKNIKKFLDKVEEKD